MARLAVKSTFSLDIRTVKALERMAKRWNISKSEALRRAVIMAEQAVGDAPDALMALDELQRSLGLTAARAKEWSSDVRDERAASAGRRERGVR